MMRDANVAAEQEQWVSCQAQLSLLLRTIERESHVLANEPECLIPHLHNMLYLDAGLRAEAVPLLQRARDALGERLWLRLVNRPLVDRSFLVCVLRHSSNVWAVDWSPGGTLLASAAGDGAIAVWDPAKGRVLAVAETLAGSANALAWSPDGRLASGHDDGTVWVWRGPSLQERDVLEDHAEGVLALAWSPNGRLLASAAGDGEVRLWSPSAPRDLLGRHSGAVYALAWSPDGQFLGSGGKDGKVIVEHAGGGDPVILEDRELAENLAEIFRGDNLPDEAVAALCHVVTLGWSPDGRYLASGSRAGTVRLWEMRSCAPADVWPGYEGGVWSLAWAPDASLLAWGSGDGQILLASPGDHRPMLLPHGHSGAVRGLSWCPDGGLLVSAGDDGVAKVWNGRALKAGTEEGAVFAGHGARVYGVAWFPNGGLMASVGGDCSARLWNATTGAPEAVVEDLGGPVFGLASAPCGVFFAPFRREETPVGLWEAASQRPSGTTHPELGAVTALGVSGDGRLVAAGDLAGTVWVWKVRAATPQELAQVLICDAGNRLSPGPRKPCGVWALSWAPDGTLLAAASADDTVIWEVAKGEKQEVLESQLPLAAEVDPGMAATIGAVEVRVQVHALAWSPDGTRLASGGRDDAVRVWDKRTDWTSQSLLGHRQPAWALTWSADNAVLASGGADASVRLWSSTTGRCLAVAYCLSSVRALQFSADGRLLRVGDDGATTRNRPTPYVFELCTPASGEVG